MAANIDAIRHQLNGLPDNMRLLSDLTPGRHVLMVLDREIRPDTVITYGQPTSDVPAWPTTRHFTIHQLADFLCGARNTILQLIEDVEAARNNWQAAREEGGKLQKRVDELTLALREADPEYFRPKRPRYGMVSNDRATLGEREPMNPDNNIQ